MVVYIAGPMTGVESYNREAFKAAEKKLKRQGHDVLNPAMLPIGMPDERYMPICIAMVEAADAVYALSGWQKSGGASVEVLYATRQGKVIMEERAKCAV